MNIPLIRVVFLYKFYTLLKLKNSLKYLMKFLNFFTLIYLFLSTNLFAQSATDKGMAWANSKLLK